MTTKCCSKVLFLLFTISFLFSSCDDISLTKNNYVVVSKPGTPIDSTSLPNYYSSLNSDDEAKAIFQYNPTNNPNDKKRGWQGCPSIGINNDKIFVAWYAGESGELPGNYILISTSDDMGQTWASNKLLIAPSEGSLRMIDPSFWTDKFNNLNLSWTKTLGIWDFGEGGIWKVKIKDVNNEIKITKPVRLFNGVMNVKPTSIGVDSSKMIFPVSAWNLGVFDTKGNYIVSKDYNGAYIYNGYYNGIGELVVSPLSSKINLNNSIRSYDEHMIVAIDDNNLLCMMRTTDGIYTTKSSDSGKTWETPTKYNDLGPTTSSRFFFGKLKSGNLLFVLNNSLTRNKLTAFLSTDNGKTWPYKLLLDAREVSYPDVMQNSMEEICVVYDRSRPNFGEILFLKFTEQDIMSGNSIKFSPKIISKLK